MKVLLVSCPPPEDVEALLKVANAIADALNGNLYVLCVREDVSQKYYLPYSIQLNREDREEEKRVFREVTQVLGDEKVVKLIRAGNIASQVLEEVEKGGYRFLIYGGTDRDVGRKIAEYSHIPTFIYRKDRELRRFLLCTDGSEYSLKAAEYAAGLARNLGAEVTVLSVAKTPEDIDKAREAVERTLQIVGRKVVADKKTEVGGVRDVILREASKYDVVTLAPRGLSKLKRALLGHVSLKVLEKADTNVLLVK